MEYLPSILTVAVIHLLGVMSPGTDFMMLTRNTIAYSRRTGIYTALGLGLGIIIHVIYSLIGIGFIISQSILLFTVIKLLGAAYLIYLGCKSITGKASTIEIADAERKKDITPFQAVKMGLLTNILNPKVTLFFLSLFTLVINPDTPLGVKLFMGFEMAVVTFLWFAFVAYLVSLHLVKKRLAKVQHFAERFIGVVLIALGVKGALATSK
jgi:RhtB (resistance to homoserine/threonine) family protein